MGRGVFAACSIVFALPATAQDYSDWEVFAQVWGYALAIEGRCDDHWVVTDVVMGNGLDHEDYERAKAEVPRLRDGFWPEREGMSCADAQALVAEMAGLPFAKVWESPSGN